MQQVTINRGKVTTDDIPAPVVEPGRVLVEVAYSLISSGTESHKVAASGKTLIQRVAEKPQRVKQALDLVKSKGVRKTFAKVSATLNLVQSSGYSCAGKVLDIGSGISGVAIGDYVACAGAGIANHAELVSIPRNLLVKVPDGCELCDAASVTLGAIAMQGVRRTEPQLGENIAVIGLGLIGQITVQLLSVAGCRVIAFDTDPRRVELARSFGVNAFSVSAVDVLETGRDFSDGHGMDGVIVTAASTGNEIMQQAMQMARKKGRVVIVGAVGLGLERSPFYEKELDLRISCSYGPGRYDSTYESDGLDYPYAYVRWTENRNMLQYLRLLAEKRVRLESIVEKRYSISRADEAYDSLQSTSPRPLAVLLTYDLEDKQKTEAKKRHSISLTPKRVPGDRVRLALVGAGSFVRGTHIPNLRSLSDTFTINAVVSRSGVNAKSVAEQLGAGLASTSLEEVVSQSDIDAILIGTRHNLHAQQVAVALRAGKHVLCEKPLALNQTELDSIAKVYGMTSDDMPYQCTPESCPILLVGFNRRFSPAISCAKSLFRDRKTPLMATYRMNAGFLPADHWVHGSEGGGRIIGEACHILDLFDAIVRCPPVDASVQAIRASEDHRQMNDNSSIVVRYADGSVCTLLYTSLGHPDVSKERMEVFFDGKVFVMDDYRTARCHGAKITPFKSTVSEKGHLEMLKAFGTSVQNGSGWPVSLGSLFATSRLSIQVAKQDNGIS